MLQVGEPRKISVAKFIEVWAFSQGNLWPGRRAKWPVWRQERPSSQPSYNVRSPADSRHSGCPFVVQLRAISRRPATRSNPSTDAGVPGASSQLDQQLMRRMMLNTSCVINGALLGV